MLPDRGSPRKCQSRAKSEYLLHRYPIMHHDSEPAYRSSKKYRVQKRWHHKNPPPFFFFFFLHFSVLDTMYWYWWIMMKTIHNPNLVGISVHGGPEIWPHEYLISPIEISVNWPGSKQLWARPIYTDFSGANLGIHAAISQATMVCIHAAISQATMNQFMSSLVCEGFSSCSAEIWSWKCWNAKKKI